MQRKSMFMFMCFLMLYSLFTPGLSQALGESATGGSVIKVSFQPSSAQPVPGYLPDNGEVMNSRNGYVYGWNTDHTDTTATSSTYGDPGEDNLIHFHSGGEWGFQLENGSYEVSVTVGDSVYKSTNSLNVEGFTFLEGVELDAGQHATVKKTVVVTDGKLTLNQGSGANSGTAINCLSITMVRPKEKLLTKPKIAIPYIANKVQGDKVIISGKMMNEHNAPAYLQVDGLGEEISRYMSAKSDKVNQLIDMLKQTAVPAPRNDVEGIQQVIAGSSTAMTIVKSGQLNLDYGATFGSPEKPVILIVDGINTNRSLDLQVYGTLIVNSDLNANAALRIHVNSSPVDEEYLGNLWINGTVHLNQDSQVEVSRQMYVKRLTYNSGKLSVKANELMVMNQLDINTEVQMDIAQEAAIGEIISNNQTANINIARGDLFVRDNISVNNHLQIQTGGVFAVGGNMTANRMPIIITGNEDSGATLLKYSLYGLKAEYYSNADFSGKKITRMDDNVNMGTNPLRSVSGFEDNEFSVRWTGQVEPRYSGTYQFEANVQGSARVWVDHQLLADTEQGKLSGTIQLEAGMPYDLQVEYMNTKGNSQAVLYWKSEQQAKEIVPRYQLEPFGSADISASVTETELALAWLPVFNADGYEIEFDSKITVINPNERYIYDNLNPGTMHSYRIRAISGDMKGPWSPLIDCWTLPAVPKDITMESTSDSITLKWSKVTGATSYEVEANSSIVNVGDLATYVEKNLNPNMQKTFRVRARNSSGPGQWSSLLVKSTVIDTPKNLKGTSSADSIRLQWDAVSGAESYNLEADGQLYENITKLYFFHTQLQSNSSHEYRIQAISKDGISEWSGKINVITLPAIPTGLSGEVSSNEITLTWEPVPGAAGYELEVDGVPVDVGADTSYVHTHLPLNSEHAYRIRARNAAVSGEWSELIVMTTRPGVPGNIQTTVTSTSIELSWDRVTGAVGYDLEVDGKVISTGMQTTYLHESLKPFSDHTYRIRARNTGGVGAWSSLLTRQTTLEKPLELKAFSHATSIGLSWAKVSGATGYDVFIDGSIVTNVVQNSYEHSDLEPYSWHVYRVRAKFGNVPGEWSEPVTQSTLLGIPGNIKIQAASTKIDLSWDPVTGATAYEVEADGELRDSGSSTMYEHKGLLPNTEHKYRVRAKNDLVVSEWSDWSVLVTGVTPPAMPTDLLAEATTTAIKLSWSAAGDAASYDLEVDGVVISGINTTTYTQEKLTPNTMHTYRVRSSNLGGKSDYTELIKKITTPELTINVEKDTQFNFVMVIPQKAGVTERGVIVTYNAAELEVLDLCALTSKVELTEGTIEGTNITIVSFIPGKIVYKISGADQTTMNIVRMMAKTKDYSKITYTIN